MHRDVLPHFCALRFGISGAHSPHIALCRLPSEASGEGGSVQVRTSPYSLARALCIAQYSSCFF